MIRINKSYFTAMWNQRRRLIVGFGLGVLLIAGSSFALSHSAVTSWFSRAAGDTSIEVKTISGPHRSGLTANPVMNRYRRRETRLLYSFALALLVLDAPTNVSVSSASAAQIHLTWTPPPSGSVNHYQIERSQSLSGPFSSIGTSATTGFDDTPATGTHSYLYRVRAVDSFGAPSGPSNMALGTSITFTDSTLTAQVTEIKAQHLYDLRAAVNAVRALVPAMSAGTWTTADLYHTIVYANDVQELRTQLDAALTQLSIPVTAYDDSTLATGASGTPIKKVHIEQLRVRSTRGSSTSSGPADANVDASATARLDPLNRTGGGGEDPLSRNFSWSLPLVGLPGRSGLDLGLSLSYNSLATWTKSGSTISFDDDHGSPSPGFRLGFPTIQAAYYNSQASKYSYLMLTPSGGRVELRQVGTSNLYQAVDSSYLVLDSSTMILRTTDGTQLLYWWNGSDYVCTQIKDRNGNYITINYDTYGRLDTVVDTLSRTITFNYTSGYLSSITQTWAGQTHNWARFTYGNKTIQTNFTGLTVYGPANSSTIHALTQVKLADDSRYDFDYTSWGQVWKISQSTGESTPQLLNYRSYNLPADNSTAQTDCPRFTQRHDWADNWNRDTNGDPQEVTSSFSVPVDAALPDNSLATVSKTQITAPDGTYQQIYFAGNVSGGAGSAPAWQRGLPLLTDTFDSGNTKQRSAATTWTQDDTNVSYQLNPRVADTTISDPAGNHARTSVSYTATTLSDGTTVNLPENTYEYQADATTQLRRTHVDYTLTSTYTNRRIIGLVSEQTLYGGPTGSETLMSKVSYQYDESGSIQGTDAPVQHDNTNYSASLVAGRGNVSSVKRYDVSSSSFTTSTMQYNTAGAVVSALDPLSHGATISYADSFSDSGNSRNTLAYPTTVIDPDGFTSTIRYNFDFGAATRKQTPLPNVTTNQAGPVQTIDYDSIGRLHQVTNSVNAAYTRYEYGPNFVQTYSTVNTAADEAYSLQVFDGAGRVIAKAGNHPGSTGGYSAQLTIYDAVGRVSKQSNPTETGLSTISTSSRVFPYAWTAAGDDSSAGWLYSQQTYDWKGRPLVTTNTDGTTKTASYGGCGCAGGEVVTLTDEGTLDGGTAKRRQQKIYADVLGRTVKTEVLNWEGGTVYATTVNTYNVRDQVTLVRQYEGADTSSTYQETTTSYDGYGRPQTKHAPEQQVDSNNALSTDHTTWSYNNDDTINTITDARGVVTTFGYNSGRMVTSITFPSSQNLPTGVAATADVTFAYDAAGNRISMTDGNGSTAYTYNNLSQMREETRTFTGLGSYTLGYDYNLAGELKKITDPTGSSISYGFDNAGRLSGVTGSDTLFASVSTYASSFAYRAFGAVRGLTYGNSKTLAVGYDDRLNPLSYEVPGILKKGYQRYDDGSLKFTQDQLVTNSKFDRKYNYDHLGRITTPLSGAEARGGSSTNDRPYNETQSYDAFGHLTSRNVLQWDRTAASNANTFVNNRITGAGFGYDADGRAILTSSGNYVYDAAGSIRSFGDASPSMTDQEMDGDGQRVKSVTRTFNDETNQWVTDSTTYYVNSTVLGGKVITELSALGAKRQTLVYAGQTVLAWQTIEANNTESVYWEHMDPSGASFRMTDASGQGANVPAELDPMGANAGAFKPISWPTPNPSRLVPSRNFEDMGLAGGGDCVLDRVPIPCGVFNDLMGAGAIANETLVRNPNGTWVQHRNAVQDHGVGVFTLYTYEINEFGELADERAFAHAAHPQNNVSGSSACAHTTDALVDLAYRRPWGQRDAAKLGVGLGMGAKAKNQLSRDSKSMPVSGFRDYLVSSGQGGDVFKHIWGVAGAVLIGDHFVEGGLSVTPQPGARPARTGWGVANSQLEIDKAQLNDPKHHDEALAEVADDEAGIQIGKWMGQAIDGTMGKAELRSNIFKRLCDH